MTDGLPTAPAVARNRDAILEVLLPQLKDRNRVLEIGSGTGEHAVYFASKMPWLFWQTSDRIQNHPGILGWLQEAGLANLGDPLELDVSAVHRLDDAYDAVFSANTAHIMSFENVARMFALVGGTLTAGGVFCLYGPFKLEGEFTSESNAAFDESLRAQDENMGIRDLEALDDFGEGAGLLRHSLQPMPANNFMVTWIRRQAD